METWYHHYSRQLARLVWILQTNSMLTQTFLPLQVFSFKVRNPLPSPAWSATPVNIKQASKQQSHILHHRLVLILGIRAHIGSLMHLLLLHFSSHTSTVAVTMEAKMCWRNPAAPSRNAQTRKTESSETVPEQDSDNKTTNGCRGCKNHFPERNNVKTEGMVEIEDRAMRKRKRGWNGDGR
eukprot:768278-Hanusia_phi.AAC.5